MANIKITALPLISTPAFTDLFPVVQGTVTYRESMDQLKTLMFSEVVSPAGVVFVAKNGSDVTGDGTMFKPYSTINFSMSSITTASSSNPFTIYIASGLYTEASVSLKPWVSLLGDGLSSTILDITSFSLDILWDGGNDLHSTIFDINLKGNINFSITNQPSDSNIIFYTSIIDSTCSFTNTSLIGFKECVVNSSITALNCDFILLNCFLNGSYSNTNDGSTSSDYFIFSKGTVFGNFDIIATASNTLQNLSFTNTYLGTFTANGNNIFSLFDSNSYPNPILIGSPTIQIFNILSPIVGGTGTGDNPDLGKILVGNGSTYDVATINASNPVISSYSSLFKTLTIGFDGSTTSNVLPTKYSTGLHISYDSIFTVVEDIGSCKDSTDIYNIFTTSANAIDISVNGLNGLDTGSVMGNTQYYVFSIGDSTGVNQGRGLYSLSSTSPTLPINFDIFRLIGKVMTNGGGDIIQSSVVDLINNAPLDNPTFTGTLTSPIITGTNYNFNNIQSSFTGNFTWTVNAAGNADITYPSGTYTVAKLSQTITWQQISGTSQTISANNGYIPINSLLTTITLPVTASPGEVYEIAGQGSGGWLLAQNAGQITHLGNVSTTTGVAGTLSSTFIYDAIRIVCLSANTEFSVISKMGNIAFT